MKKEEIKKIKDEVNEYKRADIGDEENALYTMSQSEGWKVFKAKANRMIVDLLEPVHIGSITSETNLETVGAIAISRSEKINGIRQLINEVESIRTARDEMERRQGSSESVAQ
ncbi:MAG: hypothetical protein V3574_04275 [Candidatus Moraniibacteriota bacterium]